MLQLTEDLTAMHSTSDEDIIAEKILRRAEIAKLTRQLKQKLFRAGLKVRGEQGKIDYVSSPSLSSSASGSPTKSLSEDITNNITATAISNIKNSKLPSVTPIKEDQSINLSNITPSISPLKRKSSTIYKSSAIEDDSISPIKRMNNGNIPSSPFYNSSPTYMPYQKCSNVQTPQSLTSSHIQPPRTPPQSGEYASLSIISKKKSSPRASKQTSNGSAQAPLQSALLSTPKSSTQKFRDLTTPNRFVADNEEGADLLLYLSNSPARTSTIGKENSRDYCNYLNIPTTPKSSGTVLSNINLDSTPPRSSLPPLFSSPSVIMSSSQRIPTTPNSSFLTQTLMGTPTGNSINFSKFQTPATPNNRITVKVNNRTPGFSMSDYVNIFTPSPRHTRTPDFGHNIFVKPSVLNYSKELNGITNPKIDEN